MISPNSYSASDPLTPRQRSLLNRQLKRCYENVPYYRHVFEQIKFDHDNHYQLSELQRLPTLSKEQIRNNYKDFISVKYNMERCKHSYSSGSTGEPFATYFDDLSWYRKKYFLKLRARFACGMSVGDRVAVLECVPEDKARQSNSKAWLRDPLLKLRGFSLFADTDALLEELRNFKPRNIYGYPSHLMTLANAISSGADPIPGVKRIFTASEYLKSGSRQFIEQHFSAPIFDHYGSTEFKEIAWQCPASNGSGGYHIHNDEVICEIIDSDGNVVVSDADTRRDRVPPGCQFVGASMPYFMRFAGGVGMHAGYVPDYPASHGCVRMPDYMAEAFYRNVSNGTPVIVE